MSTLYEHGVRKLADKIINKNGYAKESIVQALLPVFMLLPHILGGHGEEQYYNIRYACTLEPHANAWKKPMKVKNISVHFKAGKFLKIVLCTNTCGLVMTIGLRMNRFIVDYYDDVMIEKDPALLYLKKFFKNIWR